MTAYDPSVRTAAGARRRLRARAASDLTPDMLARIAAIKAELACLEGRHRTETDSETGDEVCRFCGWVDD